ncbi:MAG: alpha/beta hydrolase [Terrimicrobiaceae bacterium]
MPDLPPWQPLWPEGAPLARGKKEHDIPALRHFPPTASANGAAMLVLPGGGYGGLAAHEGEAYARWFASLGYHAFELRYRLAPHGYKHPAMWMDAARALRVVRARVGRVGIIGSSAGGHLAAHLTVTNDPGDPASNDPLERLSSRPDLAVLCYPVITMVGPSAHSGSRANLLGENPTPVLCEDVSPERQVTSTTPPCFVWHTVEDPVVDVENSVDFAMALRRAKVPFELHLYEKGRHGIGLANGHPWTAECARWMSETFGLSSPVEP